VKSLATEEATKTVTDHVDAATTAVTALTTQAEAAVVPTEATTTTTEEERRQAKPRTAAVNKNSAKPLLELSSRNMSTPRSWNRRAQVQTQSTHSAPATTVAVAATPRDALTEAEENTVEVAVVVAMVSTVEDAVDPEATTATIVVVAVVAMADTRTIAITRDGRSPELTNAKMKMNQTRMSSSSS